LDVFVNGRLMDTWELRGAERKTIHIPREIVWEGRVYMTLRMKTAASPHSFAINEDYRRLCAIFKNISFRIDRIRGIDKLQRSVENSIMEEFRRGHYMLSNPFVIQDPYTVSPLTALALFSTEEPAEISLKVEGKDEYSHVTHTFPGFKTTHEIVIAGLYPDYENTVVLTATTQDRKVTQNVLRITTDPLPLSLTTMTLIESIPQKMARGFTLANQVDRCHFIYDNNADIRWFYTKKSYVVFNRLANGNFIITFDTIYMPGGYRYLQEINLLGKIERTYWVPQGIHHDAIRLPNDNYLVTAQGDDYYVEDVLLEVDWQSGSIVNEINLKNSFQEDFYVNKDTNEKIQDWIHVNTIWYDDADRSIIISGRHLSIVCKLSYPDGEIKWILAPEQNFADDYRDKLLKPIMPDFKFPEAQHSPMKLSDLDSNPDTIDIVLFDNNYPEARGAKPASTDREFSQGVHYRIDEKNMTVEEIWAYGKEEGKKLYGIAHGDANYYEDVQNYLISFTALKYREDEGIESSVLEVTRDGKVVFHVDLGEAELYRSERMPLYPDNWSYQFPGGNMEIYGETNQ